MLLLKLKLYILQLRQVTIEKRQQRTTKAVLREMDKILRKLR